MHQQCPTQCLAISRCLDVVMSSLLHMRTLSKPFSWKIFSPTHPTAGLDAHSAFMTLSGELINNLHNSSEAGGKERETLWYAIFASVNIFLKCKGDHKPTDAKQLLWTVVKQRLNSFFSRLIFVWQKEKTTNEDHFQHKSGK